MPSSRDVRRAPPRSDIIGELLAEYDASAAAVRTPEPTHLYTQVHGPVCNRKIEQAALIPAMDLRRYDAAVRTCRDPRDGMSRDQHPIPVRRHAVDNQPDRRDSTKRRIPHGKLPEPCHPNLCDLHRD
jgi:hypothetical protein